jgi:uncharacterized protein YcsI (UPF0317 family)
MEMTFERWVERNKQIYEQLEYIQNRTKNMAMLGIANPGNPDFVALMKQQQKLIDDSDLYREMVEAALRRPSPSQ